MTPAVVEHRANDAPRSRAAQVTAALANSRDKLEAPFRLAEGLGDCSPFHIHPDHRPRPGSISALNLSQRWLSEASDRGAVETIREAARQAYDAAPNREAAKMTLGLLLASYPNSGKEPREEYFATLIHDVVDEGIGPHILAEACRIIRRGSRFLPTIGEVIAQCSNTRMKLGWALETAESNLAMRDACEAVISEHAKPPEEWSDEAWLAATLDWGIGRGWPDTLGPKPGEAGCLLPTQVKARYRDIARHDRKAA